MNAAAPPRLCLLIGAFHPVVGGGETQMRLLTSALQQRGIDCHVITQRRPETAPMTSVVDGVPVYRVWPRGRDRSGKYLMMLPALAKLISLRDRYDVILVSGIRTLGMVGVFAGGLLGKPVVLRMASRGEMSGAYIGEGVADWRRRLAGPILQCRNRILSRAERFVAVSRAVRAEYLACGVAGGRIVDLPNGTDVDRFRPVDPAERPALRERLGLSLDQHVVVYTGKLNRGKGLPMLLRAWNRLAARRAQLVLVGGGANQALSCEEELRAYVDSQHLDESVTFAGYQEDVLPYLQAADAFVLPSDSEAMPNSLVEAMACGLPCIATAVGGVVDIVEAGENGLLLPAGDEGRLVELMATLIEDRERAERLGRRARNDAVNRYDRRHNVDRFVEMLGRLIPPRESSEH